MFFILFFGILLFKPNYSHEDEGNYYKTVRIEVKNKIAESLVQNTKTPLYQWVNSKCDKKINVKKLDFELTNNGNFTFQTTKSPFLCTFGRLNTADTTSIFKTKYNKNDGEIPWVSNCYTVLELKIFDSMNSSPASGSYFAFFSKKSKKWNYNGSTGISHSSLFKISEQNFCDFDKNDELDLLLFEIISSKFKEEKFELLVSSFLVNLNNNPIKTLNYLEIKVEVRNGKVFIN